MTERYTPPMTPERREYALKRIARLEAKLEIIETAFRQNHTDVFPSIAELRRARSSTKNSIARWRSELAAATVLLFALFASFASADAHGSKTVCHRHGAHAVHCH